MRNKLQNKLILRRELKDWEEIYLRLKDMAEKTNQPKEDIEKLGESWERIQQVLKDLLL